MQDPDTLNLARPTCQVSVERQLHSKKSMMPRHAGALVSKGRGEGFVYFSFLPT